jgi:hypothetical protein
MSSMTDSAQTMNGVRALHFVNTEARTCDHRAISRKYRGGTDGQPRRRRIAEFWLHDGYTVARKRKARHLNRAKRLFYVVASQGLEPRTKGL